MASRSSLGMAARIRRSDRERRRRGQRRTSTSRRPPPEVSVPDWSCSQSVMVARPWSSAIASPRSEPEAHATVAQISRRSCDDSNQQITGEPAGSTSRPDDSRTRSPPSLAFNGGAPVEARLGADVAVAKVDPPLQRCARGTPAIDHDGAVAEVVPGAVGLAQRQGTFRAVAVDEAKRVRQQAKPRAAARPAPVGDPHLEHAVMRSTKRATGNSLEPSGSPGLKLAEWFPSSVRTGCSASGRSARMRAPHGKTPHPARYSRARTSASRRSGRSSPVRMLPWPGTSTAGRSAAIRSSSQSR